MKRTSGLWEKQHSPSRVQHNPSIERFYRCRNLIGYTDGGSFPKPSTWFSCFWIFAARFHHFLYQKWSTNQKQSDLSASIPNFFWYVSYFCVFSLFFAPRELLLEKASRFCRSPAVQLTLLPVAVRRGAGGDSELLQVVGCKKLVVLQQF